MKIYSIKPQSPLRPLINAAYIPAILIIIMIALQLFDSAFGVELNKWGVVPRTKIGLFGLITSPVLHASFSHLFSNIIPFFILSTLLIYTYRKIAYPVFILLWIWENALVWISARDGNHIGASGMVYGLSAFLIFIGIMRRDIKSLAVSFVVIFLYGGLIWGLLPQLFPDKNISWEGHFWGLATGIALSFLYRKKGIPPKQEENEDENEDDSDGNEYWKTGIDEEEPKNSTMKVKYYYPDGSRR